MLAEHKFQFVKFWHVVHRAGLTDFPQTNTDTHIMHIVNGAGHVMVENQKLSVRRGMVVAIPPFTKFLTTIDPGGFEMLNIHCLVTLENGQLLEERARLPFCFKPEGFPRLVLTLRQLETAYHSPENGHARAAPYAHALVMEHLLSQKLAPVVSGDAQDEAMLLLRKRLTSPDLDIFDAESLARECGLSVSQMNRRFHAMMGMAPHLFWDRQRYARVAARLEKKDRSESLAELTHEFGFTDQGYFSRWFKKMSGDAPLDYRKGKVVRERGVAV